LEAELEAQTTENIRKAREEEKERFRRLEAGPYIRCHFSST
jgi:hypothetical protein